MRLIDADKLIEKLRDFKEWENDDGRPIHTMSETQRIDRCINFAQTEPTAFDADKVVSELEKNASRYTKKYVTPYGNNGYRDTKAISIHKAIEIVKQGGVADDVCEWTQSGDMAISPHTFSKHKIKQCDGLYTLNICTHCGKKIKVVEQMDEENFCYCHNDDTDEYHDCLDYMECDECPYYYADLDQESY